MSGSGVGLYHFMLCILCRTNVLGGAHSQKLLNSGLAPARVHTIWEVQFKHAVQAICYRYYGAALVTDTACVTCFSLTRIPRA